MRTLINKLLTMDCRLFAGFLSFFISLLRSYNNLVNYDGILYLRTAQFIQEGQWVTGLDTYYWMFYSVLIAGVSTATSLSLENSAYILNAISYAIMTVGFITVVKLLGADNRVQWLAFLVIIIHPGLNEYRDSIIRDFGLWAMLPWALYCLIKYAELGQFRYVVGWTFAAIIGFLFRIEAILLLMLGPLGLYVCLPQLTFKQKTITVLKAQSLTLLIVILSFLALLLSDKMHYLGRLQELPKALYFLLFSSLDVYREKANVFSSDMSIFFKPKHGMVALFGALLTYSLYLLIKLLTPLYTVLMGYAVYRKAVPNYYAIRMVIWFMIIFAMGLSAHLMQHFFFSSRYLMPLALLMMLWVPFAIEAFIILRKKVWLIITSLIMIYMLIDGLISFGYSKAYIRDAGLWLQENKPNANVYTNSKQVAYYAHNPSVDWNRDFNEDYDMSLLTSGEWKEYDVLALRHDKKSQELNNLIETLPNVIILQEYHNKRDDAVVIIEVMD